MQPLKFLSIAVSKILIKLVADWTRAVVEYSNTKIAFESCWHYSNTSN